MIDALLLRQLLAPGLAFLLAVGAAVGGAMYLDDYAAQVQQETTAVDAALFSLRRDIRELRGDSTFVADKMPEYQALRQKGFLEPQSRMQAASLIESLALTHKINELKYEFRPEERHKLNVPRADVEVVSSTIMLQLNALLDEDIFAFLDAVTQRLKGHVAVRGFRIGRMEEDFGGILKRVSTGARPSTVTAQLVIDWTTMSVRDPASPARPEGAR
jgi:hypothetical protein